MQPQACTNLPRGILESRVCPPRTRNETPPPDRPDDPQRKLHHADASRPQRNMGDEPGVQRGNGGGRAVARGKGGRAGRGGGGGGGGAARPPPPPLNIPRSFGCKLELGFKDTSGTAQQIAATIEEQSGV
eukprot:91123-Prymnesium_polylepis.2